MSSRATSSDEAIATLQDNLTILGFNPGRVDGFMGAKTMTALLQHVADRRTPLERIRDLGPALATELREADVWSPLRVSHFLAQAAHETEGFLYLQELGGPAYLARYDGRADLGNTELGDGARFRGRGIFQLTGRANYRTYGAALGLDLVARPELAAEPAQSAKIAAAYWTRKNLNPLADADDVVGITLRINGGRNGLADRTGRLGMIKALFGVDQ